MRTMKNKKTLVLVLGVLVCLGVGFFSGFITAESVETWYRTLNKPSFNPPSWIFAPVWTILYIMMGLSAGIIYNKGIRREEVRLALRIFAAQLILNGLWTIFFFGFENPLMAFIEIIFLWILILYTILKFYKISRKAAYLLIPYILWVTFASVLNFSIWILNM